MVTLQVKGDGLSIPFKDHFSKQSDIYAASRPGYPEELFTFLAGLTANQQLAWDCATGNGQAAISLAEHFDQVIATDASSAQIDLAKPHSKVNYAVAQAESSGLADQSADLISVAAGIHWFRLEDFYKEVNRVLKPGGIIACWSYVWTRIDDKIDKVVYNLSREILAPFWPQENLIVWNLYKDLHFPYEEIKTPTFQCSKEWTQTQLEAYFQSWSASQRFYDANGYNATDKTTEALARLWGGTGSTRKVVWDLAIRVGRKPE